MKFLGVFAKMSKATVSFVMSVHPPVCLHGTTRFPLDGFAWNFIFEYFSKICRNKFKFHSIMARI